jgi:hypothetical protein
MQFKALDNATRTFLRDALKANADSNTAVLMDPRDTSFVGTCDEIGDEEVIHAIKSTPCHY